VYIYIYIRSCVYPVLGSWIWKTFETACILRDAAVSGLATDVSRPFKLSTFTSSFSRARTRNVYRYKTFQLFIACRDFRTFLFENVWVNRGVKGYYKRKATFEQAAEPSGFQIRIECHKLSSGKYSFSSYCSEFKFWDRFVKVRFELAKTAMHSQRSWWMFN